MSIPAFLAAMSGGDLPARAVAEYRCLKPPIGCGQPVNWTAVTDQRGPDEAIVYRAEWRITGLCPDCQDAIAGVES